MRTVPERACPNRPGSITELDSLKGTVESWRQDHCEATPVRLPRPLVGRSGDEALPLLLTLSSGVKGFTTIHAGSARQALSRLRFICQLSDTATQLPLAALNNLVSESVDIVVHCGRTPAGPRVTEIIAVEDLASGPESTQFTVTQVFEQRGVDQPLSASGHLPVRASRLLASDGVDVRKLLEASRPADPDAVSGRSAGARW